MANNFYFSQELRVFLHTGSQYYELILSGAPSFNQASTSEDITAETLPFNTSISQVASNRATEKIKTEFEAAQWAFTTHVRPIAVNSDASDAHAILWKYFLDHNNSAGAAMTASQGYNRNFDFNQGGSQGTFDLYFHYPNNEAYKISNCAINSASIDIALGSLTAISWSGFGTSLDTVNFTVPSTILNSSQLSSSGFSINNFSLVSYTGQTNADAMLNPNSNTGFELKLGQHKHGGDGFTFDTSSYANSTGTLTSNRSTKGLMQEVFVPAHFQFLNSSRVFIAEGSLGSTAWNDIGFLSLDTNSSDFDTGVQFGTFDSFITNHLKPSDQILIHYDNSNYAIYKVKSKYMLPIADTNADSDAPSFMGSLSGEDYTTGYSKDEVDDDGNTDGFSHYPFSIPKYNDARLNRQAFNIGFKSRKHAFYSPSLTKWIPSLEALDQSVTTTTLTQHAVDTNVIHVESTTGIAEGEALFWNNIPADFVTTPIAGENANATLPQVISGGINASAKTITLNCNVNITKGEVLHFGENGVSGYNHVDGADSSPEIHTHDRNNFASFVYYVPPNETPRLSGLHRTNGNVTYYSEPCGQPNTAARQNSTNGYTTATVAPNAVTSVTKHATNALRIRADKQIAVTREAGKGSFAANAHYASDMLAVYATRDHPAKFHIWAPYCDVNVKIYRYDKGTSGSAVLFVPRAAGGYANADGSTSLGDPINGSSGTNIDFQSQGYMTFTDSVSGLTDSDQGNVGYLAVATAINTNTSSSTHIPTPAICGLVEMTDGDANPNIDFVPFAPLSPANESIIGLDGEQIIAVSAVDDTAVANADVFTANTIGTYSPSKKFTAVNNARIAGYRYGDGAGGDGENLLEIDQLGDTYVFPRTSLTNVKIIGTGASTITIKKSDGTTIETVTISSNDVDSTHGITKTLQRGNRSGFGGADAIFTADSAGTVPAEDLINVTYVSGNTDIPIGSKVDIGGTVAYVVSSPSATTIRLDRQVTTATSTNYTFQPGYLEVAAGSDGPFYIESDSEPFYLVCQDSTNDDEHIMFGSRMNSSSSSKRNMFSHDTAFNMPSNATDLRFYPFRAESGKFHYYTSTPIQLTSKGTYYFNSKIYHDEFVSGKMYVDGISLKPSDGDCVLELEKIVSDGAPGTTESNYSIYYSRSLEGTTNNPFYMSNTNAVTAANISLSNNITPISYPILGEVTKPIGFKMGMPSATGSVSGYITGEANETDTKEFVKNITESTQPIVNLNVRAGDSTQAKNINLNIPFAFLDTPVVGIDGVATYTVSFTSLVDGDFDPTPSTNTAFKVFYT
jgi:hypothetical protein